MRLLTTTAAVVAIVLAVAAPATADGPSDTLAVYGDAPYGVNNDDTAQFTATPAFIGVVNADPNVDRVIHVGDIHSGKQFCSAAYDQSVFDLWTGFQDPLVFTPGDNEWTDCYKVKEGLQQPLEQLAFVRSIFFPHPGLTLGVHKQPVLSQAFLFDPSHPSDSNYVENVIWAQANTLFVTLNIPGGSNNDQDPWFGAATESPPQTQERTERTGATLRWIDTAFLLARLGHFKAVVIADQADMWDLDGFAPSHVVGYDPFVDSVASHTTAFGRPVLMLNGDSHIYKSDNPLSASDPLNGLHPGHDVSNFHRVVVHGESAPLEYLRLTVRANGNASGPDSFGPFSWERVQTALP
jgi:hypothetical protein